MFTADGPRLELIASAIIVPALAVVVMSGLEQLVDRIDWRVRVTKLGFDNCVLTMGVIGGVFSNPSILEGTSSKGMVALIEAVALLVTLGVAIGIMLVRRRSPTPGGKLAFLTLGMGGAALAIPIYIAVTF